MSARLREQDLLAMAERLNDAREFLVDLRDDEKHTLSRVTLSDCLTSSPPRTLAPSTSSIGSGRQGHEAQTPGRREDAFSCCRGGLARGLSASKQPAATTIEFASLWPAVARFI
jgi:hypothetical protein